MRQPIISDTPSPTSYNVSTSAIRDRRDFNRSAVSGAFHLPIAIERPKSSGPAPNQYDVSRFFSSEFH